MVTIAPYGSWKSPITSEAITASSIRFEDVVLDGDAVYWSEQHPNEKGRYAIERWTRDGGIEELLPAPLSARTRVHEYGGAAFTVIDGTIYFSNDADQRVYRLDTSGATTPLTPEGDIRHADFAFDAAHNRLIAVREDHSTGAKEAVNSIGTIPLDGSMTGDVLIGGHDFFANPRVSPDGTQLAWLSWDHPNMPWDGCELWVGSIGADGTIGNQRLVAGGRDESIFQPTWSPDGTLYFASDRTGWWNIYRDTADGPQIVLAAEREFAKPLWVFSISTFDFLDANRIIAISFANGRWGFSTIDLSTGAEAPIELPSTNLGSVHAHDGVVAFIAGSPVEPTALVRLEVETGKLTKLRSSSDNEPDRGYVSVPGAIEFPTTGGQTAWAYYYPPQNKDFAAPDGELPPLIVQSHGGPTGATSTAISPQVQYWTSRGFAVLDVDYGGSANYGREYRRRLNDKWGIVDIDDCVNGAKYLISEGLVDPERIAIQGWSASGYTTLSALAFRDFFKAGISSFGIGDLEAMAQDTHKFESRYLDGLIGPYPERRDRYIERSAIHQVDNIRVPMLILQGTEDKIVPPNQAQMMYDAVKAKGLPVALVMFEGEQHGFRKAENIRYALDSTLIFLGKVFGFEPADQVAELEIANLAG
ncbi:MAG: S9 family peptidase [Thermomicrobiales bacterium]|nr:S9 family peptidase [Thermomicrobiales bacterium]